MNVTPCSVVTTYQHFEGKTTACILKMCKFLPDYTASDQNLHGNYAFGTMEIFAISWETSSFSSAVISSLLFFKMNPSIRSACRPVGMSRVCGSALGGLARPSYVQPPINNTSHMLQTTQWTALCITGHFRFYVPIIETTQHVQLDGSKKEHESSCFSNYCHIISGVSRGVNWFYIPIFDVLTPATMKIITTLAYNDMKYSVPLMTL